MKKTLLPTEFIPAKKLKLDSQERIEQKKPMCMYGSSCYRQSPAHLKEYRHKARKLSPSESNLPPCKYGAACVDRNLLHFALYYHPVSSAKSGLTGLQEQDTDDSDDTDIEDGESSGTNSDVENIEREGTGSSTTNGRQVEMEQNECFVEKKSANRLVLVKC